MNSAGPSLQFGPFRLDLASRELWRDGMRVVLTPKAFDVLAILVENAGRTVSREDLILAVWPGVVVEENNLHQQIGIVRKALGNPWSELIQNVPRVGYRMDVALPSPSVAKRGRLALITGLLLIVGASAISFLLRGELSTVTEIRSLAVLPFTNQSSNQEEAYLGYAISEALIRRLSTAKNLSTRPASATTRYLDAPASPIAAGRQLRVESVLTGTVHRTAGDIRVTARLMRIDDGRVLWSARFHRRSAQLFDLPNDIAAAVARELKLDLGATEHVQPAGRPSVPEAFEEHMKGRYLFSRRTTADFEKSLAFFRRAIELDPNYAAAWADLGTSLAWVGRRSEGRKAREKALELDDSLAEARAGRALEYLVEEFNFPLARQEFERAIQLSQNNPTVHHWYAYYFAARGDFSNALEQMRIARRLDPTSLIIQTDTGEILYLARRFQDAIGQLEHVLQLDPQFAQAHGKLAGAYQAVGRHEDAIRHARRLVELDPAGPHKTRLAQILASAGRTREARDVLGDPAAYPEYPVAEVLAALGEKDRAFEWLDKAYRNRSAGVVLMKVNPGLDSLREDPRFDEIQARVGIP